MQPLEVEMAEINLPFLLINTWRLTSRHQWVYAW